MTRAGAKLSQLQIRVSPDQKAAIRRAAGRAGLDMSTYVLSKALSTPAARFRDAVAALSAAEDPSFALAEISSLLASLSTPELREAIDATPDAALGSFAGNYVAALVESACAQRKLPVPRWTRTIAPLAEPYFASTLRSLRLHLLLHAPAAFRRRNLFVDTDVGSRV